MIQLRESVHAVSTARPGPPPPAGPSWIEIDLTRLQHNLAALRSLIDGPGPGPDADRAGRPRRQICAVVKKNAYGLGVEAIARTLANQGCDMLAVFCADEAEALIRQSIACPLLLLMPLRQLGRTDALYRHAVAGKLHLSIHDPGQIHDCNRIGRDFGIRLPVHLYLDTGMSRSGLNHEQFVTALAEAVSLRHVQVAGVFTHLATADTNADFAFQQLDRFHQAITEAGDTLPDTALRHVASTFGMLRDQQFHMDMVRPGLALFGYGPQLLGHGPALAEQPALLPVMRWMSRIVHLQRYPNWTTIGYGCTHKLRRDSLLGIVPVGYGDGYPLALSNKATVRVHLPGSEQFMDLPVLGRVNMDQIVVDLTDVPMGEADALMHASVEVISNDPTAPNALPRLAELAGVHCYEMLCRLSPNLPRHHLR